jgi:hypothetical protein
MTAGISQTLITARTDGSWQAMMEPHCGKDGVRGKARGHPVQSFRAEQGYSRMVHWTLHPILQHTSPRQMQRRIPHRQREPYKAP